MANPIETISVSRFKATCLAVLQRVKRTGKPVLITRFGEPVAELVPPKSASFEIGLAGQHGGTRPVAGRRPSTYLSKAMSNSSRRVTCPLTNGRYCNYLNRKTLLAQRAQRIVATYVLGSVGGGSNRPHCDGGKKNVGWVSVA